jgi:hypothetical protein
VMMWVGGGKGRTRGRGEGVWGGGLGLGLGVGVGVMGEGGGGLSREEAGRLLEVGPLRPALLGDGGWGAGLLVDRTWFVNERRQLGGHDWESR